MRAREQTAPAPVVFEAFDVRVQLTLGETGYEAAVEQILPPGWKRCDGGQSVGQLALRRAGTDRYEVKVENDPWLEQATFNVALGMLDAHIRLVIAANAPDRIFVHAGVVAHEGKALVIPGGSFSGKTTLVRALVEQGASYYSDEYAVLDDEGQVHPYPRRLAIREPQSRDTQERHVREFGGIAAVDRAVVAAVAVTRYRPGAEWRPQRRSSGHGVLALLTNTVPARERPQESLRAVSRATTGAMVLDGDRGEADLVAESLLAALAAS